MKKILIVEDSKVINNALRGYFSKDYEVSCAFSLKEAKEFLAKREFDVLILDLHLPDGDGKELFKFLNLKKTKVIILTSDEDEVKREEFFEFGIVDYILKDANLLFSISEVIKVIENLSGIEKKILLIDDSKFIHKKVKKILFGRNCSLISAYSFKEAFEIIKRDVFDLIILDLELPDRHGSELLIEIRRDLNLDTPILVLSGTANAEDVRKILKYGANDYLKKPFIVEEFLLKVDLWIEHYANRKKLKEKSKELEKINLNLKDLVKREIEKNKQKEDLLLLKTRYAQLGEMMGVIVHQWRQPLNSISAAMNILKIKAHIGEISQDFVVDIADKTLDKINYLNETIEDFRNFFTPKEKLKTSFSKIVQKSLRIIKDSLKEIKVDIKIKKDEEFLCYENEMMQVVINILKNCEEALKSKKILKPKILIEIEGKKLSISDNAGGIDEKIMPFIFNRYFSTKKNSGTGIGLYISKIIVQEHCNGKIDVFNSSEGAKFVISLS